MKREVTERDFRRPELRDAKVEDYEFREDGALVRKDRWETGIYQVASAVGMSRSFEIGDVVEAVRRMRGNWEEAEPGEDPGAHVIDIRLADGSVLTDCDRVAPCSYTWRAGTFDIHPADFGVMAVAWQRGQEAA